MKAAIIRRKSVYHPVLVLALLCCCALPSRGAITDEEAGEYPGSPDSSEASDLLPVFDMHVGFGYINGARVGFQWWFINALSVESAFGVHPANILAASDGEYRYTLGLNLHPLQSPSWLTLGATGVYYRSFPYDRVEGIVLGLSAGYYPVSSEGIRLFARTGFGYDIHTDAANNTHRRIVLNLDIGLGFLFMRSASTSERE